ncbi:MAG: FHA domain-containing protein [Bacteriovorax sp.]|jgi:pSer/pThr/pTyr-binding forkhead associated (FHA) protein|nr:FHA domain-containing protein [Bacteriovorax sp.]
MIYLEIIKSSDPESIGLYEFEFDQVSIGRSKKNDLIFNEKEVPLRYIVIKIIQNQLIVQGQSTEPYFFINGKKISGTLKLKPNDIVAFGSNQIKIIKAAANFSHGNLTATYEEFNNKSPELQFALHFIEEVLLELEKDTNV